MSIVQEFKEFAVKGNAIDLAVGVVIGAAFGKIVSSLVSDIIMPPIGYITGGIDFSNLVFTLKEASEGVEAITLNYGVFFNNVIDFLIVAFAIFMAIKYMNKLKKDEPKVVVEEAPAATPEDIELLREIRDSLKK